MKEIRMLHYLTDCEISPHFTGAYPSPYHPTQSTQTNGFDFTSILQMFMPVMMMAVIVGMVGGMMRGEKKEESPSVVE
ncbi:hypothetical protein ACFLV0_03900 [Chloroflexota bacterium]